VYLRVDSDGELLLKSPLLFSGYWGDEAATEASFTEDGWFRTGDVGELDWEGYVRILGRKDSAFASPKGRRLFPEPIENRIRMEPLVGHVCIHGKDRPFPVALVILDPVEAPRWARHNGLRDIAGDMAAMARHPRIRERVETVIEQVNRQLPDDAKVRDFAVADRPLSHENGEISPVGKMRRAVVEDSFAEILNRLYA